MTIIDEAPSYTEPLAIPDIDFEAKKEEVRDVFDDQKVAKYALNLLKEIESCHLKNVPLITQYNKGNRKYKDPILNHIKMIHGKITQRGPLDQSKLASLQAFFQPIDTKYAHLRETLLQETNSTKSSQQNLQKAVMRCYISGDDSARAKAQALIEKYKSNPQFELVWQMTAGQRWR